MSRRLKPNRSVNARTDLPLALHLLPALSRRLFVAILPLVGYRLTGLRPVHASETPRASPNGPSPDQLL
jgi:hypothetical protein